jgi:hypothetical protein
VSETVQHRPGILAIATARGVVRRSAVLALVVGTLLNVIAQGDVALGGGPINWWKVGLTYCVPYCVATYGAVAARLEMTRASRGSPS